jgi:hypothetical protein
MNDITLLMARPELLAALCLIIATLGGHAIET